MSALEIAEEAELVPSLDERRDRIVEILDQAAISIGWELVEAKREHPREFMAWVQSSLPFGIDKAEKLMAICRAFANSDPIVQAALPAPWTTLYELSRLPLPQRELAIESGDIHPQMSGSDARALLGQSEEPYVPQTRATTPGPPPGFDPNPKLHSDLLARELIRTPRGDLSPSIEHLLREWLGPKET